MKKILMVAAALMTTSGYAMAADHAGAHDAKCEKECQMMVKNCGREVDSLPQRIARLKGEMARGASVYTPEELRLLSHKLEEAERLMRNLNMEG